MGDQALGFGCGASRIPLSPLSQSPQTTSFFCDEVSMDRSGPTAGYDPKRYEWGHGGTSCFVTGQGCAQRRGQGWGLGGGRARVARSETDCALRSSPRQAEQTLQSPISLCQFTPASGVIPRWYTTVCVSSDAMEIRISPGREAQLPSSPSAVCRRRRRPTSISRLASTAAGATGPEIGRPVRRMVHHGSTPTAVKETFPFPRSTKGLVRQWSED